MNTAIGLLIPFLGTALGSAMVFFMRKEINKKLERLLLGFAAGVMIAATFFSLLSPAIEMAESLEMIPWLVVSLSFLGGGLLLYLGDKIFDFLTKKSLKKTDEKSKLKRSIMLISSITLHNIPDGLA